MPDPVDRKLTGAAAGQHGRSRHAGPRWPHRLPQRRGRWLLVAAAVLVLASAAWIAARGVAARRHLERARTDVASLQSAVLDGDQPTARRLLRQVQRDSAAARRLTDDPVWRAAGAVPWLGDAPQAVTTVAAAVDTVGRTVLPPLVRSAGVLAPDLLLRGGGQVDVPRLVSARPDIHTAAQAAAAVDDDVAAVTGWLPGPVRRAVNDVRERTARLRSATASADRALTVLPPMLGSDGPRRYLIVIQNPAESRATGGLIGGYAVIEVDDGRARLRTLGSNTDLESSSQPVVDLGRDYASLYGADPGFWANANLSPHFPYAARQWLGLWTRQFGERLDGVIAIDPFTLGYVVGASGPVAAGDGVTLTEATTAPFFMHDIYQRFPRNDQNAARDRVTSAAGRRVVSRVLAGTVDGAALVSAVRRATAERRLLVYSSRAAEEAAIAGSAVSGTLSSAASSMFVALNNGGGNKLDYYLRRSVRWSLQGCDAAGRARSRLVVRLTNGAPGSGLPAWVVGDPLAGVSRGSAPPGTNRTLVYVYAPTGTTLRRATLDGRPLAVRYGIERRHPVVAFPVDERPGQSRLITLDLDGPVMARTPRLSLQPWANPSRSVTTGHECVR